MSSDIYETIYALKKLGQYRQALNVIYDARKKCIKSDYREDLNHSWFVVGDILVKLGRLNDARNAFKRSIEDWPEDPQASCELGWVCCELEDYVGAIANLLRALELDADSTKAMSCLGIAFSELGDPLSAENWFRKVLTLDSANIEAEYNLANTLYDQKKYKEAIKIYNKLVDKDAYLSERARKNLHLSKIKLKK